MNGVNVGLLIGGVVMGLGGLAIGAPVVFGYGVGATVTALLWVLSE